MEKSRRSRLGWRVMLIVSLLPIVAVWVVRVTSPTERARRDVVANWAKGDRKFRAFRFTSQIHGDPGEPDSYDEIPPLDYSLYPMAYHQGVIVAYDYTQPPKEDDLPKIPILGNMIAQYRWEYRKEYNRALFRTLQPSFSRATK